MCELGRVKSGIGVLGNNVREEGRGRVEDVLCKVLQTARRKNMPVMSEMGCH